MPIALIALAVGAFAIGTGEFVMVGLLPNVAANLSVTIPQAGHLISAYALGIVVGAPLLIGVFVRFRAKTLLVGFMVAFALGNGLSALAPDYTWLLVARFLSGLPHGAYFGMGAVAAGNMVDTSRRARGISIMFTGLTIANIAGVPAVTFLGEHLGWRAVFAIIAVIALIGCVGLLGALKSQPRYSEVTRLRTELRAFKNVQVWLVLSIFTLCSGSLFAGYSYIATTMTKVTGFADSTVPLLLVIFGLGMTVGNLVGALMADRALMRSLRIFLTLQALMSVLFVFTSHSKIAAPPTIFVFVATSFAIIPALQSRLIARAGKAPNVASGSGHAAGATGNALGAWLGGLAISAGVGYGSISLIAAAMATAGLFSAVIAGLIDHGVPAEELDLIPGK